MTEQHMYAGVVWVPLSEGRDAWLPWRSQLRKRPAFVCTCGFQTESRENVVRHVAAYIVQDVLTKKRRQRSGGATPSAGTSSGMTVGEGLREAAGG